MNYSKYDAQVNNFTDNSKFFTLTSTKRNASSPVKMLQSAAHLAPLSKITTDSECDSEDEFESTPKNNEIETQAIVQKLHEQMDLEENKANEYLYKYVMKDIQRPKYNGMFLENSLQYIKSMNSQMLLARRIAKHRSKPQL